MTIMVLGLGHLIVVTVVGWELVTGWFENGMLSTVPIALAGASIDTMHSSAIYWAGIGSFAVPLFLLGLLIWRLAGWGVRVPAVVGWVMAGWSLLCALILVPSPFYLGAVAGVLVIVAARRERATADAE